MRYADFAKACDREGLALRPLAKGHIYDGLLSTHGGPPAIRLRRVDLAEPYRTFVAFHELAHWVAHPHDQGANLERGVLGYVEREAMSIGYLALRPHRWGPPWPLVETASPSAGRFRVTAAEPAPGVPYLAWPRRRLALRQYGERELWV
jgi:hypothetical protein